MGFMKFELGPVGFWMLLLNQWYTLSKLQKKYSQELGKIAYIYKIKTKKNTRSFLHWTLCLVVSECRFLQKRNTKQKYLTKELDYVMLFKYCWCVMWTNKYDDERYNKITQLRCDLERQDRSEWCFWQNPCFI